MGASSGLTAEYGGIGAMAKKRIGILVVAYNAANTLHKVLDRIPERMRPDIEEVIVSDDSSQDATFLWASAISSRPSCRSR